MPIIPISEDKQKKTLEEYNSTQKKSYEKIPLVQRNIHTGWPLLQVSMLSVVQDVDLSIKYEQALGGGKCHYFYIGAFNFAHLLTKIPGLMNITIGQGKQVEREQVKADNVGIFLESFRVHHKNIDMKISSHSGPYGKILEAHIPVGNDIDETTKLSFIFKEALEHPLRFALKPKSGFHTVGTWKDAPNKTETQIRANINEEVATFSNGQIFIDFGAFLATKVKNEQITEYFKSIFKVEKYLELKAINSDLQPKAPPMNLSDLYSKIINMKEYGVSLLAVDNLKGHAAVHLADQLEKTAKSYSESLQHSDKNLEQFKTEFKKLLHSQDDLMKTHRELWKPISANILLALTGLGLLAIVVKTCVAWADNASNNKPFSFNNALFFAKTNRELKNEAIEESIELIQNQPMQVA